VIGRFGIEAVGGKIAGRWAGPAMTDRVSSPLRVHGPGVDLLRFPVGATQRESLSRLPSDPLTEPPGRGRWLCFYLATASRKLSP
jgi:predicted RNA-binding protein YlxR (DUF448 family)